MPSQIGLPIGHRRAGQNLVGGFKKAGLAHVDLADFRHTDVAKIAAPIKVRRHFKQLGLYHRMIVRFGISPLYAGQRVLGELCFNGQDCLSFSRRAIRSVAHQFECAGDVSDIFVARGFRFCVIIRVVITIR